MGKIMEKKIAICLTTIALCLFVYSAGLAGELPKSLTIGTHPKGSSFNAIGSGIAKVVSLNTPMSTVDRPFACLLYTSPSPRDRS